MDKENFLDDESDSDGEERNILALPDSDIDGLEQRLIRMNPKYESEEYRWWI